MNSHSESHQTLGIVLESTMMALVSLVALGLCLYFAYNYEYGESMFRDLHFIKQCMGAFIVVPILAWVLTFVSLMIFSIENRDKTHNGIKQQ